MRRPATRRDHDERPYRLSRQGPGGVARPLGPRPRPVTRLPALFPEQPDAPGVDSLHRMGMGCLVLNDTDAFRRLPAPDERRSHMLPVWRAQPQCLPGGPRLHPASSGRVRHQQAARRETVFVRSPDDQPHGHPKRAGSVRNLTAHHSMSVARGCIACMPGGYDVITEEIRRAAGEAAGVAGGVGPDAVIRSVAVALSGSRAARSAMGVRIAGGREWPHGGADAGVYAEVHGLD